jgi:hypothetical protein
MEVDLLAGLLAPLVEHDRSLLAPMRAEWLLRDKAHATQILMRHLAAAVHRERPAFTVVDPESDAEVCFLFSTILVVECSYFQVKMCTLLNPYTVSMVAT